MFTYMIVHLAFHAPGLAMIHRRKLAPALPSTQTKKKEVGMRMKSPPYYKAVWTDIASAKFSIAHSKFILIDMAEFISN